MQERNSTSWVKSTKNVWSTYSATMSRFVSGRKVKCVVSDEFGNSIETLPVTLKSKISITKQPVNTCAANGTRFTLSVTAKGTDLKFKWQKLSIFGWNDLVGNTNDKTTISSSGFTNTYTAPMPNDTSSVRYRCKITDAHNNVKYTNEIYVQNTAYLNIRNAGYKTFYITSSGGLDGNMHPLHTLSYSINGTSYLMLEIDSNANWKAYSPQTFVHLVNQNNSSMSNSKPGKNYLVVKLDTFPPTSLETTREAKIIIQGNGTAEEYKLVQSRCSSVEGHPISYNNDGSIKLDANYDKLINNLIDNWKKTYFFDDYEYNRIISALKGHRMTDGIEVYADNGNRYIAVRNWIDKSTLYYDYIIFEVATPSDNRNNNDVKYPTLCIVENNGMRIVNSTIPNKSLLSIDAKVSISTEAKLNASQDSRENAEAYAREINRAVACALPFMPYVGSTINNFKSGMTGSYIYEETSGQITQNLLDSLVPDERENVQIEFRDITMNFSMKNECALQEPNEIITARIEVPDGTKITTRFNIKIESTDGFAYNLPTLTFAF